MQINSPVFLKSPNNLYKTFDRNSLNVSFKSRPDVFVKSANAPCFNKEASEKLLSIFSRKFDKMPKGLSFILSQVNDSVLSFSKELEDNTVIRAVKKVVPIKNNNLLYVVFKEVENGVLKDSFALDMLSGELIRLNSEGKASTIRNELIKYKENPQDPKYLKYCKKIEEYADAIFGKEEAKTKNKIQTADKVEETEIKKPKLISKSPYDNLPENVQKDMTEINDIMVRISELIDTRRGLSEKIVNFKMNYEPLIYLSKKQKNLMFKYRNLESLAILHTKKTKNFTRIIHENSNGIQTHFLIEDASKIVSNLNKKRPWITPEKYRYMTKKEIDESGIIKYIAFLKKMLTQYYDDLYKEIGGNEVVHRIRQTKSGSYSKDILDNFMNEINQKISGNLNEIKDNIEKRADEDGNELASKYFKALSESFEHYAEENFNKFKRNFESYIEKFTGTNN